jgi:hypothetical protein
MKKELEILYKKGYFVRVEVMGDKVLAHYPPANILEEHSEAFTKEYSLADGGVVLDGEFIPLPFYLRRLSILCDIYSQCDYAQMHKSLIFFFKGNERHENYLDLFESLNLEDADKEKVVYKLLVGEEVSQSEAIPVFRSFKMMKGLML